MWTSTMSNKPILGDPSQLHKSIVQLRQIKSTFLGCKKQWTSLDCKESSGSNRNVNIPVLEPQSRWNKTLTHCSEMERGVEKARRAGVNWLSDASLKGLNESKSLFGPQTGDFTVSSRISV